MLTKEQDRSVRDLLQRIQFETIKNNEGVMVTYNREYVLTGYYEDGNIFRFESVENPRSEIVRKICEDCGMTITDCPLPGLYIAHATYDTAKEFLIPRLKGYIE